MAVRRIKKSWWVDFRFNHTRYRKRSPENSRAGAQAYEAHLRQRLARGESLEENQDSKQEQGALYKDFVWKWFDISVKNKKKYSVVRSYKSNIENHLIPYFGKTSINKISHIQVEQYRTKKIKEGLAKKTVNNHLIVLSGSLRCAKEWYNLAKLPKIEWFRGRFSDT